MNRTADDFIGEYLMCNVDLLLVYPKNNTRRDPNLYISEYDECMEADMSYLV